jgi:hypothetical protein
MDSPLARVILTVLSGYVIILFLMTAYNWIKTEYPQPPERVEKSAGVRHAFYHAQAEAAVQRYFQLAPSTRKTIQENLATHLRSMDQWLRELDHAAYQVICLGELHEEATRAFLAQTFFTGFSIDTLMLEATPETLNGIRRRMNAGRRYFPLLGADSLAILRAAEARNPSIRICGIEETDRQAKRQPGQSGTRDRAIAANFWRAFIPGKRHVILFGALHCASEKNWLFHNLRSQAGAIPEADMLNACVLGEHQNGVLEAFVFFLDAIGLAPTTFVIADKQAMHPWVYTVFPQLEHNIMKKYGALIVFRS